MAKYNEADIINEVKIILTENENADSLETMGMDDISLERDTLIAHLIPMAIDRVLDVAPEWMLKGMTERYAVSDEDIQSDRTKVIVPIKDNVIKVLSARVNGWVRQLHSFLTDESEEYWLLHNKYPSWTPTAIEPIGFIKYNEDNDDGETLKVLELMPGTEETKNKAKLIVLCKSKGADSDGNYDMTKECYPALIYMIAGMYYTSLKETAMAQTMTAMAVDMLGQAAKAAEENN